MLTNIGPTLETTYALQLKNAEPGQPANWHFVSQAEYTDPADCQYQVGQMYGGLLARPGMYRVVKIERMVME
jgi:hypothetical protein